MTQGNQRKQAAEQCLQAFDIAFFKALCEPVRLEIIRALIMTGKTDIAGVAAGLPQDRSVISRHLQVLAASGLVTAEKSGRHVLYDLDGPAIVAKLEHLLAAAKVLSDICCPVESSPPAAALRDSMG